MQRTRGLAGRRRSVPAAVMLAAAIGLTHGQPAVFTDEAAWRAGLPQPFIALESFEDVPANGRRTDTTLDLPTGLLIEDFNDFQLGVVDSPQTGMFATEGNQYLIIDDLDLTGSRPRVTPTGDAGDSAMAFDIIDFGDGPGTTDMTWQVRFTEVGSFFAQTVEGVAATTGPDGNVQFIGFIMPESQRILSVQFRQRRAGEAWALDNIRVNAPVRRLDLGAIAAPDRPNLFETFTSSLPTGLAIYRRPSGERVAIDLNTGATETELDEGLYTAIIGERRYTFLEEFGVVTGGFAGDDPASVGGRFAGRAFGQPLRPTEALLIDFQVNGDVDPLTPTGPIPGRELGVLVEPGGTLSLALGSSVDIASAVFDRETGEVVALGRSTLVRSDLPPGRYLLAITATPDTATDPVVASEFRLLTPPAAGVYLGDLNGQRLSGGLLPGQIEYIGFEVGFGPAAIDVNEDGLVDFADVLEFLLRFDEAAGD